MTRTIRALSYNFFLRPPFIHNRKGDLKEARLDYFLKNVLSKYDIFVFQELFTFMNTRPYRLVQAFYKHHLSKVPTTSASSTSSNNHHHDPHYGLVVFPKHLKQKEKSIQYHANGVGTNLRRLQIFDSGLCILSRYPIAATDYMIYKAGTAIDSWASKGALSALIEVEEDVYIQIVTTHVQADYNDGKTIYYQKQLEQIGELRQFIEKKSKDYAHLNVLGTFLMADLNIDARSDFKITNELVYSTVGGSNKQIPNIDARVFEGGKKYKDMMNILNSGPLHFDNVLRKMQGHHPITFGDIIYQYDEEKKQYVVKPKETSFIGRYCEACQECIDYSFFIPPTQQGAKTKVKIEGASVVTLETPGHLFPQLSDHYALETLFSIDGAREMEEEAIITSEEEERLVKEIEPIYSPSEVPAPEIEDFESPSTMPASPASTVGSRLSKASAILSPEAVPFQIAKLKHRLQQKKNRVIQDLREKKLIRFPTKGFTHALLTSPLLMLFLLISISIFTGLIIIPMMKSKPANK